MCTNEWWASVYTTWKIISLSVLKPPKKCFLVIGELVIFALLYSKLKWILEECLWLSHDLFLLCYLGDYRNPSFTHEDLARHREDPGVYRRPVPVHQLTIPSASISNTEYLASQTAPRYYTSFSNIGHQQSSSPALPLRDMSSNQLVSAHPQKQRRSVFSDVWANWISSQLFSTFFHRWGSAGLKFGHPGMSEQCNEK